MNNGGLIEPSIFGPLTPIRGYAANITDESRCLSCTQKNKPSEFSVQFLERRNGKQGHLYHPHRDILRHVGADFYGINNDKNSKHSSTRTLLPDIVDPMDLISSPKSSALVRKKVAAIGELKNQKGLHHHHYHIHTHHHYPKDGKNAKRIGTTSLMGVEKPVKKQTVINRPKTSKKVNTANAASLNNTNIEQPIINQPTITSEPLPQITDSNPSRNNTIPKLESRPKTATASTNTETRKLSSKPVSGKRKTNPVRKITPPKRKVTQVNQKKITPPKKLSDSSNAILSTDLPSSNKTSRSVQTSKPVTLHKPKYKDCASVNKIYSPLSARAALSSKSRVRETPPIQNFVVHSPERERAPLMERIRESRERKGYPYVSYDVSDDEVPTYNVHNVNEERHFYDNDKQLNMLDPRAPTGSKLYEDVGCPPRQRWFPLAQEQRSYSSPNSPLNHRRTRHTR